MDIQKCLKKNGWQCEIDSFKRYQTVDIDFINSDGKADETQFTIKGAGTKEGTKELAKLFTDFCKENHFKTKTVTSITVVASAETLDELE